MPSQAAPDAAQLRRDLGYWTEDEVCAFLGVNKKTLRNRQSITEAVPPHYRAGREKLYKVAEVEAWVKRRRRSGSRAG
jgi:hypothetical protein